MKYWASRNSKKMGPYDSREEAIKEFVKKYPPKGKGHNIADKRNIISSGYGEFGPHYDIRFHDGNGVNR